MLKIHQPYKSKYVFAFVSIGVLLLGSLMIINSSSESSVVYAAGDSRTIHDISDMQEMTQQICSNTDEGDTETLTDNRDGKAYTIIKHSKDKNCWMQQNLRLNLTKNTSIEGSTKDGVAYSWTIPNQGGATTQAYNANTWTSDNAAIMSREGAETNGNYYTWCAATAGTCASATTNGDIASASICPKGWHLPTGGGNDDSGTGEFGTLLNGLGYSAITNPPYSFPYSGYIYSKGSLDFAGSYGCYWSSTVSSGFDAYNLYFLLYTNLYPGTHISARFYGYPIRCVAPGGLPKIEKPMWEESKDSNVNVTMPTVITIDAASGMQGTAETNKITEGTIIAKVTSNGEHEVLLSAVEPSLKDPKVTTAEISPVSSTNPVQPGNNAWGIWNNNTKLYDPITKEAKTYDENITNGADNQKIHTYQVGISISPALPAGTYATEVTVTAAVK